MILNMVGGGGAGLNFSVSAYASIDDLPGSAGNNAIAVITDKTITSWMLSPAEPESPSNGMVWITIGGSGSVSFNALKKNGILIYPLSAKQYTGGVWVSVDAVSFVDGSWVAWITDIYLFNAGDTCDDVTGGWTGIQGGVVRDDVLYLGHSGMSMGQVWTKQAVDVSGYSKLKLTISQTNDTVRAGLLVDEPTSDNYGNANVGNALALASTTEKTLTCDVSALSGMHYIWISRESGGGGAETHSASISKVELIA